MGTGKEKHIIPRMLEQLGVPQDGTVLVHSAFKAFARDGYDAASILEALVDYMRPGTLMLPTMSWRFVTPDAPFFDELETPSITGYLTEKFRNQYATRRSLHPTHSVAGLGLHTDDMLDGHHLDETPCSANSPFGRLAAMQGHVVMMGIGMESCTLIHHVEEMVAQDLYLRPHEELETYTCRDRHGKEREVNVRRHFLLRRNYWQYQDQLHARDELRIFPCDTSICRGFRASDMVEAVTSSLRLEPDAIIAKPGQRYRMM